MGLFLLVAGFSPVSLICGHTPSLTPSGLGGPLCLLCCPVLCPGDEPEDLLAALSPSGSDTSLCGDSSSCCTQGGSAAVSGEPSSNNLAGTAAGAAAGAAGAQAAAAGAGAGGSRSAGQQQLDMDDDMGGETAAGVCEEESVM